MGRTGYETTGHDGQSWVAARLASGHTAAEGRGLEYNFPYPGLVFFVLGIFTLCSLDSVAQWLERMEQRELRVSTLKKSRHGASTSDD